MISQDIGYQIFATCEKIQIYFNLLSINNIENSIPVTTFYLPLIFILMLYWRIYQAARKRINKRKTEPTSVKKKSDTPKKLSGAKFRFKKRIKVPTEDWDSSQNSEAVSVESCLSVVLIDNFNQNLYINQSISKYFLQKASMRSSTKSESNGNNSDNINNNTLDVDEERRTADDVIDIASAECNSALLNQSGNCESELTQRAEHVDNDNSAKINVYEQVKA